MTSEKLNNNYFVSVKLVLRVLGVTAESYI